MTFIECCRLVSAEGLKLIRPCTETPGCYELRDFTGEETEAVEGRHGWMYLDAWTASAVCAVYDALNEEHKAKLEILPPLAAINLCWKLVK